jgi:Domain of unknown function (DUF4345)
MERRLLQIAIALAACVPVFGGLEGVWKGAQAFGAWPGAGADSHFRYLSGLLLGVGLSYWGCIPAVERRGALIRALTAIVVVGGLARLAGVFIAGDPGAMRWALVMELGVAPALCLWQARVAKALDGRALQA